MTRTGTDSAPAPTFDELAAATWPALYRYAYLLTGQPADAEDLAQQTLIKAYRAWSRVVASQSPTAYLRRTLTNTFLSQRRPEEASVSRCSPPHHPTTPSRRREARRTGCSCGRTSRRWPHVSAP